MLCRGLTLLFVLAIGAHAQSAVGAALKTLNDEAHRNLGDALNKIPEDMLDFRPAEGTMSFREITGHLITTDFRLCSLIKGEQPPDTTDYQKAKLNKADLAAAWKKSGDYCAAMLGSLSDGDIAGVVKMGQREMPKAALLTRLVQHQGLHYGNLITYMRIKGIVPPETERAQQRR